MSHTYTFVLLPLSKSAYDEIRKKLEDAGYKDQFTLNPDDPDNPRIVMQGIAVVPLEDK